MNQLISLSTTKGYFHICSEGSEASNLIICESDYLVIFNYVGVCSALFPQISILAFSIEDTHIHILCFGELSCCANFSETLKNLYIRHIYTSRGTIDQVIINFNIIPIKDNDHLMNVGSYIIVQATKDGKKIMPYDYRWGTGSMYFRDNTHIPLWYFNDKGEIEKPFVISDLSGHSQRILLHTNKKVPDNWLVSNEILLPENYVDVKGFENIYRTHNCFRVFSAMSASKIQEVNKRIAEYAGVNLEDNEAREKAVALCREHFGTGDARRIPPQKRLELAILLRKEYHLSIRQLAALAHLPEAEIRKYI